MVTCVFLVLAAVAIRLPAQQGDEDRKLFEDTKSKAENGMQWRNSGSAWNMKLEKLAAMWLHKISLSY